MNWDVFMEVWDSYLKFMDRVVQWLKYLFAGEDSTWPPADYPDFNEPAAQ